MSNGDTPPAKRERGTSRPKNITAHPSPLGTRRAQTSGPDGNCLNFIMQLSPRRFLPRGVPFAIKKQTFSGTSVLLYIETQTWWQRLEGIGVAVNMAQKF